MDTNKVICDTNIISQYLVGNQSIIEKIKEIGGDNICITPIVYIELMRWLSLYKGFTPTQRREYKKVFSSLKVLHLNKEISVLSMEISLKVDSLEPADILIGATAIYYNLPLYTQNIKHFKQIKNVRLY